MKLTLLTDLDDTLLSNPLSQFLPVYLNLLGNALANKADPKKTVPQLLQSTEAMVQNNDFRLTLEACFDAHFYPELSLRKEDLSQLLDKFYQIEFQSIKKVTQTKPEAISFIQSLFQQNVNIVVATNPLFPMKAITSRLDWADLPVQKHPFSLITAYETFHFAKPNPAYYAEILAQLGWPDGPVAMIGNSLSDDIAPATSLGINCFLLNDTPQLNASTPQGNFSDCANWLQSVAEQADFSLNYSSRDALLAFLRSTPAALDTILKSIDSTLFTIRPQPGEWSIQEVICHLRDVDTEINLPRFHAILSDHVTFIPAIDSDRWATEREYQKDSFSDALDKFFASRQALIEMVARMPTENLSHLINHSVFGPTTLGELLKFIVLHDQNHIRQIMQNISILGLEKSK